MNYLGIKSVFYRKGVTMAKDGSKSKTQEEINFDQLCVKFDFIKSVQNNGNVLEDLKLAKWDNATSQIVWQKEPKYDSIKKKENYNGARALKELIDYEENYQNDINLFLTNKQSMLDAYTLPDGTPRALANNEMTQAECSDLLNKMEGMQKAQVKLLESFKDPSSSPIDWAKNLKDLQNARANYVSTYYKVGIKPLPSEVKLASIVPGKDNQGNYTERSGGDFFIMPVQNGPRYTSLTEALVNNLKSGSQIEKDVSFFVEYSKQFNLNVNESINISGMTAEQSKKYFQSEKAMEKMQKELSMNRRLEEKINEKKTMPTKKEPTKKKAKVGSPKRVDASRKKRSAKKAKRKTTSVTKATSDSTVTPSSLISTQKTDNTVEAPKKEAPKVGGGSMEGTHKQVQAAPTTQVKGKTPDEIEQIKAKWKAAAEQQRSPLSNAKALMEAKRRALSGNAVILESKPVLMQKEVQVNQANAKNQQTPKVEKEEKVKKGPKLS